MSRLKHLEERVSSKPSGARIQKFVGRAFWSEDDATIDRAIIRADSLALDFMYGGYHYSASLRQSGSEYTGTYTRATTYTGHASCRIFRDANGNALLYGKWIEDGFTNSWCVELEAIDHFDDEHRA